MQNYIMKKKEELFAELLNDEDQNMIERIHKLPELNQDVLMLTFGLDGNEPMGDEGIAGFINHTYDGIEVNVEKIPLIRNDAINMLQYTEEEVGEFRLQNLDFEFGSSKLISWDTIAEIANTVHSMDEMKDYLESRYDKNSAIFLPSLSELYECDGYNNFDSHSTLQFIASAVYLSLKTNGYTIKANISTGDVNLATVLDFSYLYIEFAKMIVINSRKGVLVPC